MMCIIRNTLRANASLHLSTTQFEMPAMPCVQSVLKLVAGFVFMMCAYVQLRILCEVIRTVMNRRISRPSDRYPKNFKKLETIVEAMEEC
jgi:hypothetical protein